MDTTTTPSHTFRRRSLALVLALSAPLGLLACSDDEPERATVRSEGAAAESDAANGLSGGSTPEEQTDASADSGSDSGSDESSGGGATTGSSDEVIGTASGSLPAAPSLDVVALRLDVHSVRRTGEAVEVQFSITNEDEAVEFEPWASLADPEYGGYDAGGAALVSGDTRYLTLFDSADTCLCTRNLAELQVAPGQTTRMNAQISAVPEDVTEVTFTLPGFDAVDGLVVS